MNRNICVLFGVLLIFSMLGFVLAEEPSTVVSEGDVEELQGIIDQLPFEESGEANFSKYKPFYTNAEERIDAINAWLDDNVSWMRYLFHMRPQVSLLFALNLYFILFFFLIFFLNARGMWFFIESENKARIFGGGLFVAFAAIGLYVGLAHVVNNFILYIWYILADTAIWMAMIAAAIIFVLLIVFYPAALAVVRAITGYLETKRVFKEKTEIVTASKTVNALVNELTKE